MKKILASLLLVIPVAAANAADGSASEYFFQTGAGQQDLEFALTNKSVKAERKTVSDIETDATTLSVQYEYGLNEMAAVGAEVGYQTGTEDAGTENDKEGMTDLTLFVKANTAMGMGSLRYGANLELALEDAETKSSGDKNAASGGMTLYPWIGYEVNMDPCVYGARLTIPVDLGKEKHNVASGADFKTEGGKETELALFYEHKFDESMRVGADVSYVTVSDIEYDNGTADTEQISPIYRLGVYLPVAVGGGTLLPRIDYGTSSYDEQNVDGYSELTLKVGYRMAL